MVLLNLLEKSSSHVTLTMLFKKCWILLYKTSSSAGLKILGKINVLLFPLCSMSLFFPQSFDVTHNH